MKVTLDANCFIYAVNTNASAYEPMQKIFQASKSSKIELAVSRHTLAELEKKPDAALDLAKTLSVLPHWPIGAWDEQVAAWNQVAGTWGDVGRNDQVQEEVMTLAKSGNDIRDRSAYLDTLSAGADMFVTSDTQLVGSGPAQRLQEKFGLRVVTPVVLAKELDL